MSDRLSNSNNRYSPALQLKETMQKSAMMTNKLFNKLIFLLNNLRVTFSVMLTTSKNKIC